MLAGFAPCSKPDGSPGVIAWPGSDYRSDRVHRPGDAVAIAGPRRGKSVAPAVPRLAEPAISLQSDPAISRHARRVLPYAAGAVTSFNSAAAVDMDNMRVMVD
jgi:hypothetical protein